MAAAPRWKVYDRHHTYAASCVDLETAAVVVAFLDDGATIRDGHQHVIWREGQEDRPAWESYDHVAATCADRAQRKAWRSTKGAL